MVGKVFPEEHHICIIKSMTILESAVDSLLQYGIVIFELCEQVVDVIIVFHPAALVS